MKFSFHLLIPIFSSFQHINENLRSLLIPYQDTTLSIKKYIDEYELAF